jgi:hypothetical protein
VSPDKVWGGVCIYFPRAHYEIFQAICLQLRCEAKDASPLGHVLRQKRRELTALAADSWIAKLEDQYGQREYKCHNVGVNEGPVVQKQAVCSPERDA